MRITPSPAYNTTLGLGFEGTVRGCMKLEANSLSGSCLKAPPQMGAAISPSLRSLAANMASIHEESPPHLQLEIRPVRPKWTSSHQAQSSSNSSCFIWQTPANAAALDTRGNIDVNKIPSSADCDGDDESSPTGMFRMRGITHNKLTVKREREGIVEVLESRAGDVSSRGSDEEEGGGTIKKLRLAKEQSALLEECFKQQTTLNPNQKVALAKRLNLRPRQVEVWFQNRRARTKLKQTEVNYELLKRCCQSLTEENRKLQSELQELRAIKVASSSCVLAQDLHSKLASTTLIMCPSCEHLSTTSLMPRKLSRAACN